MRFVIPTAAAALLCTATLALAQGPQERPGRGGGPDRGERAMPERGPGGGGMQERGARMERGGPERGMEGRAVERGRVQADREPQQERRRERVDRERGDRDRGERRQVERRDAEQRQVERPERVQRTKERDDRAERRREREDRADRGRDRRDDRADRRDDRRDRADRREDRADRRADRGDRAERREAAREARQRLSQDQRTRFRSSFDRRHVTNVNIRVRIGTRLPRHVRLYPIPAVVVGLVPAYSYYRYVYVGDTICIVDPDTYEIIDVIEYGPGGPAIIEARLELADWERALILDSIAPDFPEAEVDLRLALGADVPGRVELHRFPGIVLDRIAKLRDYRFAVSDGDVVIIDPDDREIALIVRR